MTAAPPVVSYAAKCFLGGATIVGLAWLSIHITDTGAGVRALLDLRLRPLGCSPAEAFTIAANNLRLAAAPLVGAIVLAERPRLRLPLDVLLTALLVVNGALVGAVLGAYGGDVSARLLPHGPLELAGFSVAGGVYLAARRRTVSVCEWACGATAAVVALAAAAALEGTC